MDNRSLILHDLQIAIRKLKISSLTDDTCLRFNINNISKRKNKVIKKLSDTYGMVLTGSNILRCYGLIARSPNDIDMLVTQDMLERITSKYKIYNHRYQHTPDINYLGYIVQDSEYVDLFLVPDEYMDTLKKHNNLKIDNIYNVISKKHLCDRENDYVDFLAVIHAINNSHYYHTDSRLDSILKYFIVLSVKPLSL
jgi:hypothetical protein